MAGCCLSLDRVNLAVNSKKESNSRVNGPRGKMGFCYLPPERVRMGCCCLPPDKVKLTVNSKEETNSWVKMGKDSNWAKGQDGLLLFTP